MIQPSCVSLTELDLCHQPAFPNIFYHTMQSYVLQVFELVATTAAERRLRTARPRQGSNTQETCCPLDDPFILVTYPHFICIANSFSTKKEDIHTGYPQKASTRRDSNPRPSPWQGDTPPLSHSCIGNIPSKPHIELHQPLNLHFSSCHIATVTKVSRRRGL